MLIGWVIITQQRKQAEPYYATVAPWLTLSIMLALFKINLLVDVDTFDHPGHQVAVYHASHEQVLLRSDIRY